MSLCRLCRCAFAVSLVALPVAAVGEEVVPFPRQPYAGAKVQSWTFDSDAGGFVAANHCSIRAGGGILRIETTGHDPFLQADGLTGLPETALLARLRLRCQAGGGGEIFWTSTKGPGYSPRRRVGFPLRHNGAWHNVEVALPVEGALTGFRLDPGTAAGSVEVDHIELFALHFQPLEVRGIQTTDSDIRLRLRHFGAEPVPFSVLGQKFICPGNATETFTLAAAGEGPFACYRLAVKSPDRPAIERIAVVLRPNAKADWLRLEHAGQRLDIASDGSGAQLSVGGKTVAVIAPLVHFAGTVPKLRLSGAGTVARFTGEGVAVAIAPSDGDWKFTIEGDKRCEGPVVRPLGGLEQGLFAGLEYLGKGESSSSKADVETAEHLRFAPAIRKVTMPLMACRTEHGTTAVTWSDLRLQPIYAAPNFLDGAPGHRMALEGEKIVAVVRFHQEAFEESILWCVRRLGLPPVPQPPRSLEDQWKLCVAALEGPLKGPAGWGHCAEPNWGRHPYADCASTLFRLTGQAPHLEQLVPGGAHLRNDTIYFVTGRANLWLRQAQERAAGVIQSQKPDGSFRYAGKYQRGHYEDTSSGLCATHAAALLEHAWLTGDRRALEAGGKALDYICRFRTPRGAQTWELSLHTPDILASGYLVKAYVRGYQLTGKREYLAAARKWALSGVPFVYLWSDRPVMLYATTPVYGATNWQAPNWIGLPVQWCGLVYAEALVHLAGVDQTLDWKQLARGILIAGEQMQNPDGPMLGCLPDSFVLASQDRAGPMINPCALVSLRCLLDGLPGGLQLASDARHRVIAPFPVTVREGAALVRGVPGQQYQVLIDGQRIVDVRSTGADVIELGP